MSPGEKVMQKLHLKQPGIACGPFAKYRGRIQKLKEKGDLKYIYKNLLDNTCFTDDAACSVFRYLAIRTFQTRF